MGLPVLGDGCSRMVIGEDGFPHGVGILREAARVKEGRVDRPVPPMTAIRTGPEGNQSKGEKTR